MGQSRLYLLAVDLNSLQMVSELVTGCCASEDVRPLREVDCEILHWLERGTKHYL